MTHRIILTVLLILYFSACTAQTPIPSPTPEPSATTTETPLPTNTLRPTHTPTITPTPIGRPVTYEELCGLPRETLTSMDMDNFLVYVQETYGINPYVHTQYPTDITEIKWITSEDSATAIFENGEFRRLYRGYFGRHYTLGDIVNGLGDPDCLFYDEFGHPHYITYEYWLEYHTQGLRIHGPVVTCEYDKDANFCLDEHIVLLPDETINPSVMCMDSYRHVLQTELAFPDLPFEVEWLQDYLSDFRPWPGFVGKYSDSYYSKDNE